MSSKDNHSKEHQHIDSVDLNREDTVALQKGFREMKHILGKNNINIEDIVSLVSSNDIRNAAQKVSIRVSEESVSQMNMVAFD